MRAQDIGTPRDRAPKSPTMALPIQAPPTAPKETSGWDYWTRVYSEDIVPASRDIRISDMLSSDTLVRAKLLFLNVPPLPTAHKNIIVNLVRRELREEISIQGVLVEHGRWFLNFYRPEDALRVLKFFNGFAYRNHVLAVRFCYPDGTYGDESALAELVQCTNNNKTRLFQPKEIVQETFTPECWTPVEYAAIQSFEKELVQLLSAHTYLPYHSVLQSMRSLFTQTHSHPSSSSSSQFITEALSHWATGFVRVFNRTVKVVQNTMCLSTSPYYTQRIHDSAMEGGCSVHRNSWEPIVPEEIRSDVQLQQYMLSFLNHFGPQHVEIDIPLRILAQSLRGTWPKSGKKLAEMLTELSSGFVLINQVLYVSTNDAHREKVIDNLAAFQDDCNDAYYVTVLGNEPVKACEFEEL